MAASNVLAVVERVRKSSRILDACKCCFKFRQTSFSTDISQDKETDESAKQNAVLYDRDPAPLFINPNVQEILKRLTGLNMEKIFDYKPSIRRSAPKYKFMTENQLQTVMKETHLRALEKLQMPPVLREREPINEVVSYDPDIRGFDTLKYVFTDISLDVPHRERVIVVREPDGTLRKASWEERDRMIQTFFPSSRMKHGTPRMFLDESFKEALEDRKYKYILDRACVQYEPDHPTYIKVCHKTYEHIDKNKEYDVLHSTRHYGPMLFHLAFYKQIDNILQHLIQKDKIEEAGDVVRLYHILQPDCKSVKLIDDSSSPLDILKAFTQNDAVQRSNLELVLQTYQELQNEQNQHLQGVRKAHGQE